MRGPNMWSPDYHHIIAVKFSPLALSKLDDRQQLAIAEYFGTNENIELLNEDINAALGRCVMQLAANLQGAHLYHNINYPSLGILYGVVAYKIEKAGVAAVERASAIVASLLNGEEPQLLEEAIEEIRLIAIKNGEGPSTTLIIEAAKKRNIPVTAEPAGYTIFGYGKYGKRISAALSHYTSVIGVNIAGNKEHTKKFLESANIPTPKGVIITNENELSQAAGKLGFPLVTKPFNGNQGRYVTCGITNLENLRLSFYHAKEGSRSVIIEKEIKGKDYRLLVIGNKFHATCLRFPAFVIGDGVLSIYELVEKENSNPMRGNGHENVLTKIKLDAAADLFLQNQGFSQSFVPMADQQVFLKSTANLSTGGTAEDVTDLVHPSNRRLAEKVSRTIGLDICGIDIVSQDISIPLQENGGAVIEVNAAPGLRMHQYPSVGRSREVGKPIVDLMFKDGEDGRIPIIAITGTNGKTTTTRLMAHVATHAGHTVGFSSTDGIYIGGEKVQEGDCSGPQSAKTILHDATVDFAVLECARGGIIRSGLGFDQCDIAIVTNVAADHLGLKDVFTIEDLALVKSVVPASVKKEGWAILNAANGHAYAMKDKVKCNVALFCSDENNAQLQEHIRNGCRAIYTDSDQDIYITTAQAKIFICNAADIPITRNGKAGFMVENVLPVILAAHLSGFKLEQIVNALKGFIPSADETPGRINEFEINGINVIVDYAHNPHGLQALSEYLKNIPAKKLGIITGTGDRREEDIIEFGRIAAATYDDIIIRFDRDLRGRTQESIIELLTRGIYEIDPQQSFKIIPDTQTAIHHAVENAEKGSYVVVCADNATYTVGLTKNVALQFQDKLTNQ